jgi:crotonobetainyl-CoA:carnitine CoA-transferase CaiB-like acyl-CoA transferase
VPIRSSTAEIRPKGPAPVLGEHSRTVLQDAGYAEADIDHLVAAGVVGVA